MSDRKYWEEYYKDHSNIAKPSPFAEFVWREFNPVGTLIELGCGSGRDSIFFLKNDLKVTGIDQCTNIIKHLNSLMLPEARFLVDDFTKLQNRIQYNNIYSRFTLHSVSQTEASSALNWAFSSLKDDGLLFIEVRSVEDNLFGQGTLVERDAWKTDHYRRFIRKNDLIEEMEAIGFKILYDIQSTGLARYKDEDPMVIRIVGTK